MHACIQHVTKYIQETRKERRRRKTRELFIILWKIINWCLYGWHSHDDKDRLFTCDVCVCALYSHIMCTRSGFTLFCIQLFIYTCIVEILWKHNIFISRLKWHRWFSYHTSVWIGKKKKVRRSKNIFLS